VIAFSADSCYASRARASECELPRCSFIAASARSPSDIAAAAAGIARRDRRADAAVCEMRQAQSPLMGRNSLRSVRLRCIEFSYLLPLPFHYFISPHFRHCHVLFAIRAAVTRCATPFIFCCACVRVSCVQF